MSSDSGNGSTTDETGAPLGRRAFLRTAIGGAAGAALVACEGDRNPGRAGDPQASLATTPTTTTPTMPIVPGSPPPETWNEPWVWRPSDWPGQALELNVVENENPGATVGFGNPSAVLFSYNGSTPGPTIRMRGDETLFARVRNILGENFGTTYIGPAGDPATGARPPGVTKAAMEAKSTLAGLARKDFCLGEHTNGVHSVRTTNLHTHGLHVRPGRNPDGTHSDNVIFRLISQPDYNRRQQLATEPECEWLRRFDQTTFLRDDEQTGYADYEFHLGDVQAAERGRRPPQPHPPGTHWYHPHSHGATHNQVASGMAGFLIVEGDVDDEINEELTGIRRPDPQFRTGPNDYIERLMFIQRVLAGNRSTDPDARTSDLISGRVSSPAVNGDQTPMTIVMRQHAIERWRVLNGSVDGRGFKRFMVLEGQYAVDEVSTGPGGGTASTLVKYDPESEMFRPIPRSEVWRDKQHLLQLSYDGVTLVRGEGDTAEYFVKDLAEQGNTCDWPAGVEDPTDAQFKGCNPLDRPLKDGEQNKSMLENFEACYADADGVRDCYVRPNEVYLGPANRTDVFFNATTPGVYTVLARAVIVHADNYQNVLQGAYDDPVLKPPPQDIVVAYIVVEPEPDGDEEGAAQRWPPAVTNAELLERLNGRIAGLIPEYLKPVTDDEIRVRDTDEDWKLPERRNTYRTRTITYSGWGAADFPLITTAGDDDTSRAFARFVADDQKKSEEDNLELLRYAKIIPPADDPKTGKSSCPDDTAATSEQTEWVLLPPATRTMAISPSTSTEVIPDESDDHFTVTRSMGRKFDPSDRYRPRMLEGTAEEWAVYNSSISLWADTDCADRPLGQFQGHWPSQPLLRAEGQQRFRDDTNWRLQTKSVDHPFHIHQNPCWVLRIEVPDQDGNLVNILEEPRWQDVIPIPRNRGRVVFRSRFPDYVGLYVNHCHILLHEDNGMMQAIEAVPFAGEANYDPADELPEYPASYAPDELDEAYVQSLQFIDPNHVSGQKFPGFDVHPPGQKTSS